MEDEAFEWHFDRPNAVAGKENQPQAYVQGEAWPGANAKRRPIGRYTVELSISTASIQQLRLIKERLRCHHVQLKVVETTMGRKEQRERERKKAAKGSYALSGFGFLPKKRSWSDGDLNATATTSQRQLVDEDSSSRSSRLLQEQDEGSSLQSSSATQVSVEL